MASPDTVVRRPVLTDVGGDSPDQGTRNGRQQMHCHRIRLSAAWEALFHPQDTVSANPRGRFHLPFSRVPDSASGDLLQLRRRFHRPGGLTGTSVVRLVLLCRSSSILVQLNGNTLSALRSVPAPAAVREWAYRRTPGDVTDDADCLVLTFETAETLQAFNELIVTPADSAPADQSLGGLLAAWLEISDESV